jgi:putative membrane protein
MAEQTPQSAQRLDTATELAFDRTRAAYERTMMAWIRTATSLITFGFTIYKFFQTKRQTADNRIASSGHASSLLYW